MADPAARRPVSADVGEGMLEVTIRRTEGNLLYRLVQNEILEQNRQNTYHSNKTVFQCTIIHPLICSHAGFKMREKVKTETKSKPQGESGAKTEKMFHYQLYNVD